MRDSYSAARAITNLLNPFTLFTALYVLVALENSSLAAAALYTALELAAAGAVVGYVLLRRRSRRARDFWLTERSERLVPALVLLGCFAGLLVALWAVGAPPDLIQATLTMGTASALAAALTLVWKVSAHTAVAGYTAVAGVALLGLYGWVFVLLLPLVLWSRVSLNAHTLAQTLTGAALGAAVAAVLL